MTGTTSPIPGLQTVGLLGGGVIGGGWAARFLLNGVDVKLYDPDPEAPRKIGEVMANARRALAKLFGELVGKDQSLGGVRGRLVGDGLGGLGRRLGRRLGGDLRSLLELRLLGRRALLEGESLGERLGGLCGGGGGGVGGGGGGGLGRCTIRWDNGGNCRLFCAARAWSGLCATPCVRHYDLYTRRIALLSKHGLDDRRIRHTRKAGHGLILHTHTRIETGGERGMRK